MIPKLQDGLTQRELFPPSDDAATRCTPAVLNILGDGKWHLCSELVRRIGPLSERTMREIAERSNGGILSGQKGYRLTEYATSKEAMEAERWLQSQGKRMVQRALDIRRARARG